jgi:hypothetical protein
MSAAGYLTASAGSTRLAPMMDIVMPLRGFQAFGVAYTIRDI